MSEPSPSVHFVKQGEMPCKLKNGLSGFKYGQVPRYLILLSDFNTTDSRKITMDMDNCHFTFNLTLSPSVTGVANVLLFELNL